MGTVKLNFDSVLFHVFDFGVWIILMDDKENALFAWCRKEFGLFEVNEIEALVALRELQMILHLSFSSLILERDYLFIIEAIGYKAPNFLGI